MYPKKISQSTLFYNYFLTVHCYLLMTFYLYIIIFLFFRIQTLNAQKSTIVCNGNFHQGDDRFRETAGAQCLPNVLGALATLPLLYNPESSDLDDLLNYGDILYRYIQQYFHDDEPHIYIDINRIRDTFPFASQTYSLYKYAELYVHKDYLDSLMQNSTTCLTLIDAINQSFKSSKTVVVMIEESNIALYKRNENYFSFDPHSRNENGLPIPNGFSVLLKHSTVQALLQF